MIANIAHIYPVQNSGHLQLHGPNHQPTKTVPDMCILWDQKGMNREEREQ
jgi:hypothetical protein